MFRNSQTGVIACGLATWLWLLAALGIAAPGDLLFSYDKATAGASLTFGKALAVTGQVLLVGDPGDDGAGPLVRAYDCQTTELLATLVLPAFTPGSAFGSSIACPEGLIAVGAPNESVEATTGGAVYLFDAATSTVVRRIANPSPHDEDQFGYALAASGNLLAVGTPGDDTQTTNGGCVYVFSASDGQLVYTLRKPTAAADDSLGRSLAPGFGCVFAAGGCGTGTTGSGVVAFDLGTGALRFVQPAVRGTGLCVVGTLLLAQGVTFGTPRCNAFEVCFLSPTDGSILYSMKRLGCPGYYEAATDFGEAIAAIGNNPLIGDPRQWHEYATVFCGANMLEWTTVYSPYYVGAPWYDGFAKAVASSGSRFYVSCLLGNSVFAYEGGYPDAQPPACPTALTATKNPYDMKIDLSWSGDQFHTIAYVVERSTDGGPFVRIELQGGADWAVEANHRYTYRVKSVNLAGESCYSNEAVGQTLGVADIAIWKKVVTPSPSVGFPVEFAVEVFNYGTDTPTTVTITDTLPAGATLASVDAGPGMCTSQDGVVVCHLNNLAPLMWWTVLVRATFAVPGVTTNTVVVSSSAEDLMPSNNEASVSLTVRDDGADLSGAWVSATQSCGMPGRPGRCRITGQFTVANSGPKTVAPTQCTFLLSQDETPSPDDIALGTRQVGRLTAGASRTVRLNSRLATGVSASGWYVIGIVDAANRVPENSETNNTVVYGPIP